MLISHILCRYSAIAQSYFVPLFGYCVAEGVVSDYKLFSSVLSLFPTTEKGLCLQHMLTVRMEMHPLCWSNITGAYLPSAAFNRI